MAKKNNMPDEVFIGRKNKIKHKHCVLAVISKHPNGTPRECRLFLDDEIVDVRETPELVTAYIPAVMFKD